MTLARELLRLAGVLAETPDGIPGFTHVGRNRAVSSAYYAVFHRLAQLCASELAGLRPSKDAYRHIYRSLDHGVAKTTFESFRSKNSDATEKMKTIASIFIDLQRRRHQADYDPFFYVNHPEMSLIQTDAETAIEVVDGLSNPERKLLAALLIGRTRR